MPKNNTQQRKYVPPFSKDEFLRGSVLPVPWNQTVQLAYKVLINLGTKH